MTNFLSIISEDVIYKVLEDEGALTMPYDITKNA